MNALGYSIAATSDNWSAAFQFVNRLLRGGRRVLVASEGDLAAGTFVIPASRELDPWFSGELEQAEIHRIAAEFGVELSPMPAGCEIVVRPAKVTRVGLYGGGGAPFNHAGILAACGFPVVFLSDADVRAGQLAEVDVFVMPGGGERAMFGQIEPLGEAGCLAIAEFVRGGGMYIGCCAGSYDCIVNGDEFLAVCPAQRCLQLINAGPWRGENAVGFLGLQSPGVGVVRVTNARPDHPVMYGMPDEFSIVHYNGPVLDPEIPRAVDGGSAASGLARFAGWTDAFTPAEEFAGTASDRDSTYLAQAVRAGRFSIAAGELGLGKVVAFGSHPEFGFDLAMADWGEPARMFANAVLWQAVAGSLQSANQVPARSEAVSLPSGSSLRSVQRASESLQVVVGLLEGQAITPAPSWLAPEYSMSVFGLPPHAIWRESLSQIALLAAECSSIAEQLREAIELADLANTSPLLDAVQLIDRWVLDERGPEWGQDGGYQGVRHLLLTAAAMCQRALEQWNVELGPPAGPYDYFNENPYHLVAGSYLAAIGCVAGATQLMRGLRAEWAMAGSLARTPVLSAV
jgi:hypothetical protein